MKKILLLCLVIVIIASLSISVSATTGGFVDSPSLNPAPELVKDEIEDEECKAELVITAYVNRNELPEKERNDIEKAYTIIRGTKDLSTLNEKIATIASNLGIEVTDLAVSDLFDISLINCEDHVDHGYFDITLKADTLDNFVCLLHYYNGEWKIVDNASVTNNGEYLEFAEDEFSPFAIVVYTGDKDISAPVPQDNNNGAVVFTSAVAVAGAAAVTVFFAAFKRKSKKE